MVKEKREYPYGLVPTKHGIGRLSHPRLHPHLIPVLRRNVSPNPLLGLQTLKGGGFGLTEIEATINSMVQLKERIETFQY
jgi:hypothetical protein